MTDVLLDDDARHLIRTSFESALFVEAGAGTGKTSELVRRVVAIVTSGRASLREIVAITFTEAAAGELRERIRSALERVVSDDGDAGGHCRSSLEQLDEAPIQTIHAFANRVLQRHGSEVGLPPVLEVLDDTRAALAFKSRWASFARSLFASEPGDNPQREQLLRTAWALGMRPRTLRSLAQALEGNFHRFEPAPLTSPPSWFEDLPRLIHRVDMVMAHLPHCANDDDTLLCKVREQLHPWRQRLQVAYESGDELAVLDVLVRRPAVLRNSTTRLGSKANWPSDVLDTARRDVATVEIVRREIVNVPEQWALEGMLNVIGSFVLESHAGRKRTGVLEFQDLLVLARDLARRASVRASLRQQYRYVFVDEFQDTDPLQAELITLLTSDDEPAVAGVRLFTVGDPKQSIYRFRNADVNQYLAMRREVGQSLTTLTTNFRTLPGILTWIGASFEQLLAGSLEHAWNDLVPGRSPGDEGSVTVFGETMDAKSADIRQREADDLADRLLTARDQRWCVHATTGERAIRFGDMAVLMPTRRSLPALERAFRAKGVPYRVESRSLLWATQEIRDVVAILRAFHDPTDERAVVAALRSPAFACADDELVEWRAAGGGWSLVELPDGLERSDSRVARSMLRLRHLRHEAEWCSVPQLVSFVIERCRLFEAAFARERQRESWNRLRFLVDQAHLWADDGGGGLHDFLLWIAERQQQGASALESVVPEADDDAVRVMTIHAAKGLEFPLTAVIGLGSRSNTPESVRVLWPQSSGRPSSGRPQVRLGSQERAWQTGDFETAAEAEKALEADEQRRLLYVAATRARDHLVISLYRPAKGVAAGASSLAGQLASVCAELHAPMPRSVPGVEPGIDSAQLTLDLHAVDVDRAMSERQRVIEAATRPSSLSATAIATKVASINTILPVRVAGHEADVDDLSFKLAFGSAVHAVLESVDLRADESDVSIVVKQAAERYDLQEHHQRLRQSVFSALASQPVNEARSSGRWWREVYVASTVDDVVIGGSIDLLYEREDGFVIVDYKTEAASTPLLLQEAVDRYRFQLLTYAVALRAAVNKPVAQTTLLFVPPGEPAVSANVPLDDAEASLRGVLRS